ncbi:MAG: AAA family ATPase [Ardenticatenales bacterium]|nr:AAA family ATPase [Ardenticatenales bacterium]
MHPLLRKIEKGGTPPLSAFMDAFDTHFDLLDRLAKTAQDPEWHGEGNVLTHTGRVLNETYAELAGAAAHLEPSRRLVLVLGALLHDIAKPLVTRTDFVGERERLIAPHHADRGRSYLAYPLLDLGLPHALAWQLLALVGHHHDPKKLVLHDKPIAAYRRLARLADLRLLYHLERADMRGRDAPDISYQLDLIEMFRLYAEEFGLWGNPDPYAEWRDTINEVLAERDEETQSYVLGRAIHEAEAGLIMTPHEAIARAYGHLNSFPTLVVTCGPSGSGKSSWIEAHLPDYQVVSLDALRETLVRRRAEQSLNGRVRQAAREALREHLRHGERVVWDATTLHRDGRGAVLKLGFDYHAHVTLVLFHVPEAELLARNEARAHPVPGDILRRQLDSMDFPYASEAHRLLVVNAEGVIVHSAGA